MTKAIIIVTLDDEDINTLDDSAWVALTYKNEVILRKRCKLIKPPKIKYTKQIIYAEGNPYISLNTLTEYDKGFDDCLIELGIVKKSEVEEYEEGEEK